MPRIAIFISGRITCYDTDLKPVITELSRQYEIGLFISVNGFRDEYAIKAEEQLKPWLKSIRYEEFVCPIENNTHKETLIQIVDGKRVPYTVMSCFYNDMKAFELIEKYEIDNNMEYDIYCKFRADITLNNCNYKFEIPNKDSNKLYSCIPPCPIRIYGWQNVHICVCDAFAYGNKKIMKIYCNTYNWILDINNKLNGKYRINYETAVTENIIDTYLLDDKYNNEKAMKMAYINNPRGIEIVYFKCTYNINKNRQIRDKVKH